MFAFLTSIALSNDYFLCYDPESNWTSCSSGSLKIENFNDACPEGENNVTIEIYNSEKSILETYFNISNQNDYNILGPHPIISMFGEDQQINCLYLENTTVLLQDVTHTISADILVMCNSFFIKNESNIKANLNCGYFDTDTDFSLYFDDVDVESINMTNVILKKNISIQAYYLDMSYAFQNISITNYEYYMEIVFENNVFLTITGIFEFNMTASGNSCITLNVVDYVIKTCIFLYENAFLNVSSETLRLSSESFLYHLGGTVNIQSYRFPFVYYCFLNSSGSLISHEDDVFVPQFFFVSEVPLNLDINKMHSSNIIAKNSTLFRSIGMKHCEIVLEDIFLSEVYEVISPEISISVTKSIVFSCSFIDANILFEKNATVVFYFDFNESHFIRTCQPFTPKTIYVDSRYGENYYDDIYKKFKDKDIIAIYSPQVDCANFDLKYLISGSDGYRKDYSVIRKYCDRGNVGFRIIEDPKIMRLNICIGHDYDCSNFKNHFRVSESQKWCQLPSKLTDSVTFHFFNVPNINLRFDFIKTKTLNLTLIGHELKCKTPVTIENKDDLCDILKCINISFITLLISRNPLKVDTLVFQNCSALMGDTAKDVSNIKLAIIDTTINFATVEHFNRIRLEYRNSQLSVYISSLVKAGNTTIPFECLNKFEIHSYGLKNIELSCQKQGLKCFPLQIFHIQGNQYSYQALQISVKNEVDTMPNFVALQLFNFYTVFIRSTKLNLPVNIIGSALVRFDQGEHSKIHVAPQILEGSPVITNYEYGENMTSVTFESFEIKSSIVAIFDGNKHKTWPSVVRTITISDGDNVTLRNVAILSSLNLSNLGCVKLIGSDLEKATIYMEFIQNQSENGYALLKSQPNYLVDTIPKIIIIGTKKIGNCSIGTRKLIELDSENTAKRWLPKIQFEPRTFVINGIKYSPKLEIHKNSIYGIFDMESSNNDKENIIIYVVASVLSLGIISLGIVLAICIKKKMQKNNPNASLAEINVDTETTLMSSLV